VNQDLDPLLRRLNLANTRRTWSELVRRAEKEAWSFEAFLQTLCAEEIAHRRGTRLTRAVRAAAFPFLRTIEEFDFSFQSTLRLTTIGSLLSPDFITQGNAVILEGKPGRGKTHLAVAIAYRALQNGFDALFTTAAELIDDLSVASRSGKLRETLSPYLKPHVLVVDEVGYLTYGTDAANVFFHVVNERHVRHKAMIFTTNKHPTLWGSVLHDDQLAEAIVDRILERGRLLRLDGPSVRTKHLAQDDLIDEAATQNQGRRISGIHAAEFPERTSREVGLLGSPWGLSGKTRNGALLPSDGTVLLRAGPCFRTTVPSFRKAGPCFRGAGPSFRAAASSFRPSKRDHHPVERNRPSVMQDHRSAMQNQRSAARNHHSAMRNHRPAEWNQRPAERNHHSAERN